MLCTQVDFLPVHFLAHWPQLAESERVSTHAPPHCESPALHDTLH